MDSGTWGDSPWYVAGLCLSLAVGWCGTIPATLLVTRDLARRGIAPRTARTSRTDLGLPAVGGRDLPLRCSRLGDVGRHGRTASLPAWPAVGGARHPSG